MTPVGGVSVRSFPKFLRVSLSTKMQESQFVSLRSKFCSTGRAGPILLGARGEEDTN